MEKTLFEKICDQEIPADIVYEDDQVVAFRDIAPKTPVHALVIPKGRYVSFDDFSANAPDAEIAGFMRLCAEVCAKEGVSLDDGNSGFRAITNAGTHGVQEVPHFHLHIMGGRSMGPMIALRD